MNAKGELIARLLNQGQGTPIFEAQMHGPPHERTFRVQVIAGGHVLGVGGEGRSKKDAERLAAEAALRALDGVSDAELPDEEAQSSVQSRPPVRWPIYSGVLEAALEAALDLASEDATLDEVRADAARLYRDLLADLGHGPEDGQ